jgi:hypothetical protein
VICLLLFEFGVARQPVVRQRVLTSGMGDVGQQLITPGPPPRIVVFGNSRMLYGVEERQLADQVSVPRATVLKLAWNAASVPDYLHLYERNRAMLSQARVVIIGLDDWDVACDRYLGPEDAWDMSLKERLTVPDWRYVPLGIVTWACRSTYMLRQILQYCTNGVRLKAKRLLRLVPDPAPGQSTGESGVLDERNPATERLWATGGWYSRPLGARSLGWSATAVVDRMYGWLPTAGCGGLRQLRRLVDLCTQDGATVLIVRPPLRDDYLRTFSERYPSYAQAFAARVAEMNHWAASSGGRLQVRIYGAASTLGLTPRAFYDYGHPSPLGRAFLTSELADWVRAQAGTPS